LKDDDNCRGRGGVVGTVRTRGRDFDDFVAAAASRLFRVAYGLTGDQASAEDLLQDVLERLYIAWPRVDDPMAYSRRALVNHSANRWRRRARHPETALTAAHERTTADHTQRTDDRDELIRALATLPAGQRAVIILRFLDDMSEADTASVLGCSVGTVKSQTARARDRLRLALDPSPEPCPRSTTR
jgi:RNA polymerase sigma-70 factor (sigma-E family)